MDPLSQMIQPGRQLARALSCTLNSEDADAASAWVQEFDVAPSSGQIVSHDGQHYIVTERPQLALAVLSR